MRAPISPTKKIGIKRGPWTAEEDEILANFVKREGEGRWRTLPKRAGLLRCGKSCRLRWMNYLRPSVKRGRIAPDEEDLILRLHRLLGNRWSLIAGRIPGRTDNEIKNYWNTHLSKKLISQGIDPRTHKPLITYHTTTTHDAHHQSIPQITTTTTTAPEIIGSSHQHQINEARSVVPNIHQTNMGTLMEQEQGLHSHDDDDDEEMIEKNTSNHNNNNNGVDLQAADTTLSSFLDSLINDDNITSSSSLPSFDIAFWESEFLNTSSPRSS